jgi:hypothetical protein
MSSSLLQPELTIGGEDHPLEADQVADDVARTGDGTGNDEVVSAPGADAPTPVSVHGTVADDVSAQRAAIPTAGAGPISREARVIDQPGRPLRTAERTFMQSRMAADFSGVRGGIPRLAATTAAGSFAPGPVPGRVGTDVHRSPADGDILGGTVVPTATQAILARRRGRGIPLPQTVTQRMEDGLGVPLGNVRVHTDPEAGDLARQLQSTAFTLGSDIYFSRGSYAPSTGPGQRLLAHELAHVTQQHTATPTGSSALTVGHAADPTETRAEMIADTVQRNLHNRDHTELRRRTIRRPQTPPPPNTIQREPFSEEGAEARVLEIDAQVRDSPELPIPELARLLQERDRLLPLITSPPRLASAAASGEHAPESIDPESRWAPTDPSGLTGAIPLAAFTLVPLGTGPPPVPLAVLLAARAAAAAKVGTGALATAEVGTAALATAEVGTAALATAEVGTAALVTAEVGTAVLVTAEVGTAGAGAVGTATAVAGTSSVVPVVGWIVAGVIVVGIVSYVVYRHYSTTVTLPPSEPAELPGAAEGDGPVSLPGASAPAPQSLPGASDVGPTLLPGAPTNATYKSDDPQVAVEPKMPEGLSHEKKEKWKKCKELHEIYDGTKKEVGSLGAEITEIGQYSGLTPEEKTQLCAKVYQQLELVERLINERRKFIDSGCDEFDWFEKGLKEEERRGAHEDAVNNLKAQQGNLRGALKKLRADGAC